MAVQKRQKAKQARSGWTRLVSRAMFKPFDIRKSSQSSRSRRTSGADNRTRTRVKPTIKRVVGLAAFAQVHSRVTVVFIHYHPDEYIAPGFAKLVQSAIQSGFRTMFVSTARPSRVLPQLGECPSLAYVHRENYGYDFGALKDARDVLVHHGLLHGGRYVILNSSMLNLASAGFGSDQVLDELCTPSCEVDLLGVTASYEASGYHIQTYFYSASSNWFCSRECTCFLDRYMNGFVKTKLDAREYAIKNGELALSRAAMNEGFSVSSIYDDLCLPTLECYSQIEALRKAMITVLPNLDLYRPSATQDPTSNPSSYWLEWLPRLGLQSNPSQSCWSILLFRRFFFLKRELLEFSNPHFHHAPSVVALLMPLLQACEVELPSWSDLDALPRLVHVSKPKKASIASKNNMKKSRAKP